jgi:hypothetical protein
MTDEAPSETAWIADFTGLPLADVLSLAEQQGRAVRTVRPGDAVTMDWRPQRLNVQVDDRGELVGVRAG